MTSPSAGSTPTSRGRLISFSASSRVTVADSMLANSEAVFGFRVSSRISLIRLAFLFAKVLVSRDRGFLPSFARSASSSSRSARKTFSAFAVTSASSSSPSTSVTYGPKRPSRATIMRPFSGLRPSSRPDCGVAKSFSATSRVSSSGVMDSGRLARCASSSPLSFLTMRSRYGP